CQHRGAHNDRADSRAPRPGRRAGRSGVSEPCAAPGRVLVLTALHCRAAAPGTGGSWLAAGCASISRWNAKIRPTHHARSGRLGADSGLGGRPSGFDGSTSAHIWALIRIIRLRSAITPGGRGAGAAKRAPAERPASPAVRMTWARRLKRVFGIEIERCVRCGGRLKVIASIEELEVIERILAHRRERGEDEAPTASLGARAPPQAS